MSAAVSASTLERRAPELVSFGCRLNASESEVMAKLAAESGLRDAIIVNTCAVTDEAERQARQAIRRLRRENPRAIIVATGCAAQIDPARFAALPEIDHVIGNDEKLSPATWRALAQNGPAAARIQVGDIMAAKTATTPGAHGFLAHTRAFIAVQQGCDHRCTFCVIPFGRGPSRSVPLGAVVEQARRDLAAGAREIVLTGVDLTAWGEDLPGRPRFSALVRRLLAALPELPRLRLSSLDPAEIDGALIELFAAEPRLMPHLHLSLQAGDDLILKRMKRRHDRAQGLEIIARARAARPDIAIGADLIAGFPTEDDAMFARTAALIDEAGLDFVHVFPFSPRRGAPASRMPQLPRGAVRERARFLRDAAAAAQTRFLARQHGRTLRVLVERSGRDGHAENFAAVALDAPAPIGAIVTARATGAADGRLIATALRDAA